MSFINMDLSNIERRMLAHMGGNMLHAEATRLPKKHPFRFALLYSAGPRTAERMTRAGTTEAERRVHLEAEIQCFECWQRGEDPMESAARCGGAGFWMEQIDGPGQLAQSEV